ncbi:hypothetical protein UFOVP499_8 [uncultured Caudovirales phage]|uniref:Holin of 3TMs, for gene-transfer release n=1 Tax=uncultured Caudovirales phage TaxID=2100421 RepID=A0A6J5MNJ8_9CAUD|nr:hypothetical protein UFOVP499_8 [uncultured Caudovirales phage]
MDWLKTIAPTIATALGGPLAGLAIEAVSKAIGIDPKDVQATIDSGKLSADQIMLLKQAEIAMAARAQEMGLDFAKLNVEDRKSAREMQVTTHSHIPPTLAILIVLAWATVQGFLLTNVIDPSMRELIARVLGTLDGALMLVLSFYFGSSSGSQTKDALLHQSTPSEK